MCEGCWIEAGSPMPSIAAMAARPALQALERYSCVGGALHIVTDDYNCETDNLEWCKSNHELNDVEQAVFDALFPLSETQRIAALAYFDGYAMREPAMWLPVTIRANFNP